MTGENGKKLSLSSPPKVTALPAFKHGENYSRTVGDMAKGSYCNTLDFILDCCAHLKKQITDIENSILEIREQKFARAPADWELSLMHELKRIMHGAAILQFLHNLGVNTGPRPSESKHMRKFKKRH